MAGSLTNLLSPQAVIGDMVRVCRERGGALLAILTGVAAATVLGKVAEAALGASGDESLEFAGQLLSLLVAVAAYGLGNGATSFLSVATLAQTDCSIGATVRAVGKNAVGVVVTQATVTAASFAGCFLCGVPGVFFAVMFWLAATVAVVEGRGPFQAMRRSARLTLGHRRQLFVIGVLYAVAVVAIWIVMGTAVWLVIWAMFGETTSSLVATVAYVAIALIVQLGLSAIGMIGWLIGSVAFHRLQEAAGELRPDYTGVFE